MSDVSPSKLFTVGPVEMFPETLAVSGRQVPYFRNDFFSDVMRNCDRMFRRTLGCEIDGYRSIVLTASGTGAMEAVVINCLDADDRAIVIDGGSFGHRFAQICELHHIPHDVVSVPFEEALTPAMLAPFADDAHTALLVNLDETSIGKLYDLPMLSEFCKAHGMLLIVDAISSYLADPIDMADSGIDALIVSSQKALSLSPGISLVALSPRMVEERIGRIACPSLYFDFTSALENAERGQTPFTPAVGIVMELEEMLERICDVGVDEWISNTALLAADFREKLVEVPVELPCYPLSNAVTPIIFPAGGAQECNRRLVEEFALTVNPCGGTRADTMSRVAHIGNHTREDNTELVDALKTILG